MLLAAPILLGTAQEITPEEVKASYILKLYPFVLIGHPPHRISTMCYVEKPGEQPEDSVGQLLAKYLQEHTGSGTIISARKFHAIGDFSGCDVVYIAEDEEANIDGILAKIGSAPVLTISSVKSFIFRGGMIEFVTDDANRVKMAANLHNIKASHVTVNAEVLEIMQQVITP